MKKTKLFLLLIMIIFSIQTVSFLPFSVAAEEPSNNTTWFPSQFTNVAANIDLMPGGPTAIHHLKVSATILQPVGGSTFLTNVVVYCALISNKKMIALKCLPLDLTGYARKPISFDIGLSEGTAFSINWDNVTNVKLILLDSNHSLTPLAQSAVVAPSLYY